jgi:ferredoxin-NADP reductase/Na+-transporting NADH:ubiquinone oxidoreductase subunit NqrB
MQPFKLIDNVLNRITMYRLLVYGLSVLLAGALFMSTFTGRLFITPEAMISSFAVIITAGYLTNLCLPLIFNAASNRDSSLITSLILCCILQPSTSIHNLALMGLAAVIAISSKYIVSYHYKHLFNPAAFAALVLGLTKLLPATWWIGNPTIWPLAIIFGFLVLRKIRRFQLFFCFLAASLAVAIILGLHHMQTLHYVLSTTLEASPLIFLGSIMLTEPATTPPRVWQQRIYGIIVGAIFTSQLRFGIVSATPEMALIIGNLYAYIVSPKYKLKLKLSSKKQLAPDIYDFGFEGGKHLNFKPGQYLEWTLKQNKSDSRGNRRTFSIVSAPGDNELHIAIKLSSPSSLFKKDLVDLEKGGQIIAGQLAGDFVLPASTSQKLSFIAGGIGITPFVSMARDMINKKVKRDIVLLYIVPREADYCYDDIWQAAKPFGLKVIPVLTRAEPSKTWTGLKGRLTKEGITKVIPDYSSRRYYLSGPNALVDSYGSILKDLKIGSRQIVTDHFSGY